jgi:hypothetical protein
VIQTAKLNDVDPQAWLADVLARIAENKITDLSALLPGTGAAWSRPPAPSNRGGASPRRHYQPRRRNPRRERGAVVGLGYGHEAGGRSALDLRHGRPALCVPIRW